VTVDEAYRVCRATARREAKNFYYAFLALPREKHNAICAVYAFMRRADDISDDESEPHAARRANLDAWMDQWRRAAAGESTEDPVFLALNDTRRRFRISLELLEQLVEGTAMDLEPRSPTGLDTYATFDDLYRYCYLVASVVGLVCICIFEYEDPRAEQLAEELGIAFQLTNILRDVREDAARGRVYLPLSDLAAHKVGVDQVVSGEMSEALRAVLADEAVRAENFYRSGEALLPLIATDSRPSLWVMMRIYHRLLERIRAARYEVMAQRVSVPTGEKLWILARGLARTVLARATARPAGRGAA
jgi:phytoene synthase